MNREEINQNKVTDGTQMNLEDQTSLDVNGDYDYSQDFHSSIMRKHNREKTLEKKQY